MFNTFSDRTAKTLGHKWPVSGFYLEKALQHGRKKGISETLQSLTVTTKEFNLDKLA